MEQQKSGKKFYTIRENTPEYRNTQVNLPKIDPAMPRYVKWKLWRRFTKKLSKTFLNPKTWKQRHRISPDTTATVTSTSETSKKTAASSDISESESENDSEECERQEDTTDAKKEEVVDKQQSDVENKGIEEEKKDYKLDGIHIFKIVVASVCFFVALVKLVIGSIYIDKCPTERNIPIWLIVSGSFLLLFDILAVVDLLVFLFKFKQKIKYLNACIELIFYLLFLFYFAWFICGNAWVFIAKTRVQYYEGIADYCDERCFMVSYGIIIAMWCFFGIALFFIVFLFVDSCCATKSETK